VALVDDIRAACAHVAARARSVAIDGAAIAPYSESLSIPEAGAGLDPAVHLVDAPVEDLAAFYLTLDAVNFGSGWFPELRKREGLSGYGTLAAGLRDRFAQAGPWFPSELSRIDPQEVADVTGQDPGHQLVPLWTAHLRLLGERVGREHGGDWLDVVAAAGGSAVGLVELLEGWESFGDVSEYQGRPVPFLKRAQLAAADLHLAGVVDFDDLGRLTMFADNLVPHVLAVDGVLHYAGWLSSRIERGELLEHGAPEEVEIRACAVHAVELLVEARSDTTAQAVDHVLWNRGQEARYKALPRHRARCTAY